MINNDKAIEYGAELLKTKTMLDNISSLGIDVTADIKLVEEIDLEIKNEARTISSSYSSSTQSLKETSFEFVYIKGINKLKEVQNTLKIHDIYFMGKSMAESLKLSLNDPFINPELVRKMADAAVMMINDLNNSDTRALDSEKDIINELYEVAFEIMKLEISYTNDSIILKSALNNEVMYQYLNSLVRKSIDELEEMPFNLKKEIAEIHSKNGINPNYLTKEILGIISKNNITIDIKNIENILKDILEKISQIQFEKVDNDIMIETLKSRMEIKNESRKKVFDKIVLIFILGAISAGTLKIALPRINNFYATDVFFNTSLETIYEGKVPGVDVWTQVERVDDSITLFEVTPWTEVNHLFGENDFERTVTTYDLTNSGFTYNDIVNYFIEDKIDLNVLGIKGESKVEKKDSLALDDLYKETYEYIEYLKQEQNGTEQFDEEEYKRLQQVSMAIVGSVFAAIILFNILLLLKRLKKFNEDRKYFKENKLELEKKERLEQTFIAEINDLQNKYLEIFENYKEHINDKKLINEGKALQRKRNR